MSTTDSEAPLITEQVNFYCDTFWTFLYSSLDVLSQIINQVMKLKLDEDKVSFKSFRERLLSIHGNHKILTPFDNCLRSRAWTNLDKYRNCSLHRRHIYTKEITHEVRVKESAGYVTESTEYPTYIVVRLICDDPYDPQPKLTQNREIPKYMLNTKEYIFGYIVDMLKALTPEK